MAAADGNSDKWRHAGHRARLRARFLNGGADALADYEMLELVLFMANTRGDVKPLAKRLIAEFGSYAGVLSAGPRELTTVTGVGDAAVVAIKTVQAGAVWLAREEIRDQPVMSSWKKVVKYCRAAMAHEKSESFRLLFLNRRNELIADEAQQRGTVDHTPVYPREVVKRALELGASAVIMVHNHPSGDPGPSQADVQMTKEVMAAGAKLGVSVHDHLIVGRKGHSSLRELGLM